MYSSEVKFILSNTAAGKTLGKQNNSENSLGRLRNPKLASKTDASLNRKSRPSPPWEYRRQNFPPSVSVFHSLQA